MAAILNFNMVKIEVEILVAGYLKMFTIYQCTLPYIFLHISTYHQMTPLPIPYIHTSTHVILSPQISTNPLVTLLISVHCHIGLHIIIHYLISPNNKRTYYRYLCATVILVIYKNIPGHLDFFQSLYNSHWLLTLDLLAVLSDSFFIFTSITK